MKLLHIDSSARRNSLITDEWTLAASDSFSCNREARGNIPRWSE